MTPTATCQTCEAAVTDRYLCPGCTNRLTATLRAVPDALIELATTITRQTAMPTTTSAPTGPVCDHTDETTCGCGVRLPWHDHAARIRAQLRHTITTATRRLLTETSRPTALILGGSPAQARWLAANTTHIAARPWAGTLDHDLAHHLDNAWRAIDRPEDRLYVGPCGTLQPAAVDRGLPSRAVPAPCPRRLWARPDQTAVTCPACRTIHQVADRQETMLAAAEGLDLPGPQIASALTTMTRRRISPSTIRSWAHRGQLTQRGTDPTGRKLYRVGDVLTLINGATMNTTPSPALIWSLTRDPAP